MIAPRTRAFTLVEMMVSTAVVIILLSIMVTMTGQAGRMWRYTDSKVEQFRESRTGFEVVTRRLSQATLNTYWDYRYNKTTNQPEKYERKSELRFRSGPMAELVTGAVPRPTHGIFFQAPLGRSDVMTATGVPYRGMDSLLNTWGCFLEFGDDKDFRPTFLNTTSWPLRYRYRLLEMTVPTEQLSIYNPVAQTPAALAPGWNGWFAPPLSATNRPVRMLSENIVALVLLPRLAAAEERERAKLGKKVLADDYRYDSMSLDIADAEINQRNQLPPVVQVTMVAIDEPSALRLASRFGTQPPDLKMGALFKEAKKLEDNPATPIAGDGDLDTLQKTLVDLKANFRVFSATVSIRGAKWSRAQIK